MLIRATSKDYNHVVAEMVDTIRSADRSVAGNEIEALLARQTADSRYWPDDREIEQGLTDLLVYRRLRRGRLRMVLETIEDHLRGWQGQKRTLGGERFVRGSLAIEHILPRKWQKHWPLEGNDEAERGRLVHTLGNLTLLTGKLNSSVSNGPWLGTNSKRSGLEGHDVLLMNRDLLKRADGGWTEEMIRQRTKLLVQLITQIWPVPDGHQSAFSAPEKKQIRHVELSDLLGAGVLHPGMLLTPRRKRFSHRTATLLADGQVEVDGKAFSTASEGASYIHEKKIGGWWFFLTDVDTKRSLRAVRRDYVTV